MDVVIIGAGYAGSLIASQLENYDIVVFDKNKKRKNKSVTTFREVVDEGAIKNTYSKLTFMNTKGTKVEYDFNEEIFAFVDYQKLCDSLWTDIEEKKVVSYDKKGVVLENGERIEAKVVVDCSGIDGENLRRNSGINIPPRLIYITYERVDRLNVPDDTFYLIVGCSIYGGWIYPAKPSEIGAANLFKRKENVYYPETTILKKSYPEIFGESEVKQIFKEVYPYGFVKRVVNDNVILFGDSAGLTHPMYATSIHYIHHASKPLSESIKSYLNGYGKLEEYQKWWKSSWISTRKLKSIQIP